MQQSGNQNIQDSGVKRLLLLDASLAAGFGLLDGLLVVLCGSVPSGAKHGLGLERSGQVANRLCAKQVDLDDVCLKSTLQRRQTLHQQWVGVLHVQVHETSHGQAGEDRLDAAVDLGQVVLLHGGGDELLFGFALELVWLLEVLEGGQVVLLGDFVAGVEVNEQGGDGGGDIEDPDIENGVWVFPVKALGDLHHDEHEQQVGDCRVHLLLCGLVGWSWSWGWSWGVDGAVVAMICCLFI